MILLVFLYEESRETQALPCKLMVHVVLFPLSSTTTLVAAAMFESETACSAPFVN